MQFANYYDIPVIEDAAEALGSTLDGQAMGTFADLKGISFLEEPAGYYSNRWLSTILVDPATSGTDREKIRLHLETDNIESRPL